VSLLTRRSPAVAWTVFAVSAAMLIATAVLGIADPASRSPADIGPSGPSTSDVAQNDAALIVFEALAFLAVAAIGGVVSSKRPRNAVGWLFSMAAFFEAVGLLAYALYWHFAFGDPSYPSWVDLFAWFSNWTFLLALGPLLTLIPLLFPTGAPPTPRWRVVGWTAAIAIGVAAVCTALAPGPMDSSDFGWIDNPLGVGGAAVRSVAHVATLVAALMAPFAAASLVVRYRRSRGVERLQMKWVTTAVCILIVGVVATTVEEAIFGGFLSWPVLLAGLLLVAGAMGIALLRYRLYDIDVVVNRTLVYGALTLTLAAVYVASVLLLQLALNGATGDSSLAVAASTLAVAAIFRPARSRIQEAVDRRFFRRRYDARQTLEEFSSRLRDQVELAALDAELRGVVTETMQPAHVSLWLRGSG